MLKLNDSSKDEENSSLLDERDENEQDDSSNSINIFEPKFEVFLGNFIERTYYLFICFLTSV